MTNPFLIKISKLYYAVDGSQEPFEAEFAAQDFEDLPLTGSVTVRGHFLRVEEGIMLIMEELKATQAAVCSFCTKALKVPVSFEPSEWLFYEEKPLEDDASNELLFIDKHQMEINVVEPIRQELILNLDPAPRCKKPCKSFAAPDPESKPLSQLKDLL